MVSEVGLGDGWLKLPEAAKVAGVHPESLRRRWRYGGLPEGSVVRLGGTLFFWKPALEQPEETQEQGG
jgi:hypothetical protein